MMREVVTVRGRVSHECSICGKLEPWSDSWSWYGSYREIEDGKQVIKFCSDDCKEVAIGRRLVPEDTEQAA